MNFIEIKNQNICNRWDILINTKSQAISAKNENKIRNDPFPVRSKRFNYIISTISVFYEVRIKKDNNKKASLSISKY